MRKAIKIIVISAILFSFSFPAIAADSPLVTRSKNEGKMVFESAKNVYKILNVIKRGRDRKLENDVNGKYVSYLVKNYTDLNVYLGAIINFVTYGTPSTLRLPVKERAGVLISYKEAFLKLPITQAEWTDVILIANGSQPLNLSPNAERLAKKEFRRVYGRDPDMRIKNESAAIMIIAYGVRPIKIDLNRERSAILKFEKIYGYKPAIDYQWNIIRAMAYSGVR